MKRLLLFQPGVETLSFFSERLAEEFVRMGYEVRLVRIHEPFFGTKNLIDFILPYETALITFNFHGIQREAIFHTPEGELFWDKYHVSCINIIVDHPFYYYEELKYLPESYLQICIDEDHTDYMKQFYPHVLLGETLPLAGCDYRSSFGGGSPLSLREDVTDPSAMIPNLTGETIPFLSVSERSTPVVFTGCFTNPDFFLPYMNRNGEEYNTFYHGILDDLLASPDQCIHTVYLRHLNRELPELTTEDLRNVMNKMIFLDLWIRFTYRGKVIASLVDGGVPVHCIGAGWETLPLKNKAGLSYTEYSDTQVCLKAISEAKISLNVMPWFKRGAHDRIYSSMHNGAVCVTDKSRYLTERYNDGDLLRYYDLNALEKLPDIVTELLEQPEAMQQIADRARAYAGQNLTWKQYAKQLIPFFS